MIALLATLSGRVVYPSTVVCLRCRFVDEATDADTTPAAVKVMLRPPGGDLAVYTWTAPSSGPTPDARLLAFTSSSTSSMVIFEAQMAIVAADKMGTWAFGWTALDGAGNELVTEWGAFDVEAAADNAPQPSPTGTAPQPFDEMGADVWGYGFPPGSFYY